MKITKTELAKIVKEETEAYLSEREGGEHDGGSIYQNERYVDDIKNLLGDALQNDTENVRKALEALQSEVEQVGRSFREGVLKEDWVRELQNAQYALEDKVEGVVIDTELEQPFYDFLKQLKAHIAEKSKSPPPPRAPTMSPPPPKAGV